MPEFVISEIPRIKNWANGRKETVKKSWLIPRVVQNDKQVFWCDTSLKRLNTILELFDFENEVLFTCVTPENIISRQGVTPQKIKILA